MGWEFALGEFVGGPIIIVVVAVLFRMFLCPRMLMAARAGFVAVLDHTLVDELLASYEEMKTNHYLGGHRLTAVEASRFCEAATRVLEQQITGAFTPLSDELKVGPRLGQLESRTHAGDDLRLHIPRTIRVIYDVRNKRNTAHLKDGIDPNFQDSGLVVANCDWVLAELVRLLHNVKADEAAALIEDVVTRRAPAIQDFDGFLKVLNQKLPAGDHLLLLLDQCGRRGATFESLKAWSRPNMVQHLSRTLERLVQDKAWVHELSGTYVVTDTGRVEVARRKLALMPVA